MCSVSNWVQEVPARAQPPVLERESYLPHGTVLIRNINWENFCFIIQIYWKVCIVTITRSSWFNCALRDDEALYWVIIGHYEAVEVGNWLYWVSRGHLCLYILHKVEFWTGVTDASLTDSLTTLKDSATQLLIKYKSGALVTQWYFLKSGNWIPLSFPRHVLPFQFHGLLPR